MTSLRRQGWEKSRGTALTQCKKNQANRGQYPVCGCFYKSNCLLSLPELTSIYDLSDATDFNILHKDSGLVKKSSRWLPKLLSEGQKLDRIHCSQHLVNLVQKISLALLDIVVTMYEYAVSFHTPEKKISPNNGFLGVY